MPPTRDPYDDWLGAWRRAAEGLRTVLADHPTTRERLAETGRVGGGGDRTLVIDRLAEDHVFRELEQFHRLGHRFTAISEERGRVDFGSDQMLVIVDPLDGSLNAKRGLPTHALSIAVADGPTMADVRLGYVYDLGAGEEWRAVRGSGAFRDRERLQPPPERRWSDGRLELLGVEAAGPRTLATQAPEIARVAHRIRVLGVMAVTFCQVAASRIDAAISLTATRAVDTAAAQLIVREAGGHVEFVGCPDGPLGAPLDLAPSYPLIAARSAQALDELRAVPHGSRSAER